MKTQLTFPDGKYARAPDSPTRRKINFITILATLKQKKRMKYIFIFIKQFNILLSNIFQYPACYEDNLFHDSLSKDNEKSIESYLKDNKNVS